MEQNAGTRPGEIVEKLFSQDSGQYLVFEALARLTPLVLISLAASMVAYLILTRFAGGPALVERLPRTIFVADLFFLPTFWLVLSAVIFGLIRGAGLTGVPGILDDFAIAMTLLTMAWLLARAVDLFFWQGYVPRKTGVGSSQLLRGLTYWLIIAIALLFTVVNAGYSVTGFLVSTGVIAAVLGLALQNTLNDFFSGVALSAEQPFRIGEWIELDDGTIGEVVDLTRRSTRLQSFNSSLYVIPNSKIASRHLHNFNRPSRPYSEWYYVMVMPSADPALVRRLLLDAALHCRLVLKQPAPIVRLSDATTIPYKYMVWVHYATYLAQFPGRDALFQEIDNCFGQAGIKIAAVNYELATRRAEPVAIKPPTVMHLLRSVDMFESLSEAQLAQLAGSATFATIDPGTIIAREGDHTEHLYVIVTGVVSALIRTERGKEIVTANYESGECFGQASLLLGEPTPVTVRADSEVQMLMVTVPCVRPILDADKKLYDTFAKVLFDRMQRIDRIRHDQKRFENASRLSWTVHDIRARLVHLVEGPSHN
ncbi:MAG: mechanosensitive ion channel family protein [Pseudomonadota bacterium]